MLPRCVLVQRPTEYVGLLERHGTREQARFFLKDRGLDFAEVEERHLRQVEAHTQVLGAVPVDWKVATVTRSELDRFLFTEDDVVLVLGQDGLVANVAKYLNGQPVIGLNPEPQRFPGVLVPHAPQAAADLCADVAARRATIEARTMVQATLDDGQQLLALNELMIGHRSHQSARYSLEIQGRSERQSSSGVVVATGTGATGWAKSLNAQRPAPVQLPAPTSVDLAWFVREPWESPATHATLTEGVLGSGAVLKLRCELDDGGVVFGDGIEADRLNLDWGQELTVGEAKAKLLLVR